MPKQTPSAPAGFKLRHRLDTDREHGRIFRIAWSPNGQMLASPAEDKKIRLWEATSGQLCRVLEGHGDSVISVGWSPDGSTIASGSYDKTVRIWEVKTGNLIFALQGHPGPVNSVSWSRDGQVLASGSNDSSVRLWDAKTGQLRAVLQGHSGRIRCVAWSPDGRTLASGSEHNTIRLWNAASQELLRTLEGHTDAVFSVAWSPDGHSLASASEDHTVRLWAVNTGRLKTVFEGHTKFVTSVSFSCDGRLLASRSHDRTVRIWDCDMLEMVAVLEEEASFNWSSSLAFSPKAPVLAILSAKDEAIDIWDLDLTELLGAVPPSRSVHYVNAKVVLLGDTGVGKTGLGLALTRRPFKATESSHGRHVWKFDSRIVEWEEGRGEIRETFLWDLAGQPGYRLIHQLYLNEVAVAVVVFDARNETDPFAGVRHWERALQQAQRMQNAAMPSIKKFLVCARIDRGGVSVSRERIDMLVRDLGFDRYFETSAKAGINIAALAEAIRAAIAWDYLPKVSSTELLQRIQNFLIEERRAESLLSTPEKLYRSFLRSAGELADTEELRSQFETSIGRVEARGLIRRLSFGNFILLEPELLDAYASALVNAAKEEPEGLGCIPEDDARSGRFRMLEDERLADEGQEKILLIATIEELLRHEIALREQTEHGSELVFPSQFTRDYPQAPDPEGKAAVFEFEGPVLNVYTTLAVRLVRSGIFLKNEMWKNAAIYTTKTGGRCGILLREIAEGRGELTVFYEGRPGEELRLQFEEYVHTHLLRRALRESVKHRRVFVCPECATPVSDVAAIRRRQRGVDWILCGVCETRISLRDRDEPPERIRPLAISEMDRAADAGRELDLATAIIQGKKEAGDFDVFLCHNTEDKPAIRAIGGHLQARGILPWLDEWNLPPGRMLQEEIERMLPSIKAVAVFVGPSGFGPWESVEMRAAISQFVKRKSPVIPVLLPGVVKEPDLPLFLREFTWVRFLRGLNDQDAIDYLEWGITGTRPRR